MRYAQAISTLELVGGTVGAVAAVRLIRIIAAIIVA